LCERFDIETTASVVSFCCIWQTDSCSCHWKSARTPKTKQRKRRWLTHATLPSPLTHTHSLPFSAHSLLYKIVTLTMLCTKAWKLTRVLLLYVYPHIMCIVCCYLRCFWLSNLTNIARDVNMLFFEGKKSCRESLKGNVFAKHSANILSLFGCHILFTNKWLFGVVTLDWPLISRKHECVRYVWCV
jgi:hypothetical protein